jgi:hypothetical protein
MRAVVVESPASQAGNTWRSAQSSVFAPDIAGQRDDAEAGDRCLLERDHVVTQDVAAQHDAELGGHRAKWVAWALAPRFLVGGQPVLTQAPPSGSRSTIATFLPASPRRRAGMARPALRR